MELITWARAKRRIPQADIDSFYHRPLAAPTLFRFDTASFDMPAHAGPFSLKAVLAGEETYEIGARTITLRPGEFMFVNGGETYSSRIDTQTRSLSIFLPARDARLAARSALDGANDIPESIARRTNKPDIAQVAFQPGERSRRALADLNRAIDMKDDLRAREHAQDLLATALRDLFGLAPPARLADIKRRSTRDEIRRRLMRVKELIDQTEGCASDLDQLAVVACLSKFHFLRLFADLYGQSPGAYARRRRLQAALRRLARGESVQAAARAAGYRDLRAFKRACARVETAPASVSN